MNNFVKNAMRKMLNQLGPKLYEAYALGYEAAENGEEKLTVKTFIQKFSDQIDDKIGVSK